MTTEQLTSPQILEAIQLAHCTGNRNQEGGRVQKNRFHSERDLGGHDWDGKPARLGCVNDLQEKRTPSGQRCGQQRFKREGLIHENENTKQHSLVNAFTTMYLRSRAAHHWHDFYILEICLDRRSIARARGVWLWRAYAPCRSRRRARHGKIIDELEQSELPMPQCINERHPVSADAQAFQDLAKLTLYTWPRCGLSLG